MVPSALPSPDHLPGREAGHEHGHACGHLLGHSHSHGHAHAHGPLSPHPAQAAPWSILRMTVVSRIGAALVVSAGLWAVVLLAMR